MTASITTLNPNHPRLTPVGDVLPVIAPGSVEADGNRVKVAIIRRFDRDELRILSQYFSALADRMPAPGGGRTA